MRAADRVSNGTRCECRGECGRCPTHEPARGALVEPCPAREGDRYGAIGGVDPRFRVTYFDMYVRTAYFAREDQAEAAADGKSFAAAMRHEESARAWETQIARFSHIETCVLARGDDGRARCQWCRRARAAARQLAGYGPTETAWMEAGL